MSHRVDHWHEALVEHLTNREWSPSQIEALSHDIGRSALMSSEGVLRVLEVQQQVDEQIAAEREMDRVFFEDSIEAIDPGFMQHRFEETL